MTAAAESMEGGAAFSPDRVYRYSLWRQWGDGYRSVMFVGLNPSTADETQDDPTIRRCLGFAKSWGCTRLVMANLFALRATAPKVMLVHAEPVGSDNDMWLSRLAHESLFVVAAWGAHGGHRARDSWVRGLLGNRLWCLGCTAKGQPRHPLYLRADTLAVRMPPAR